MVILELKSGGALDLDAKTKLQFKRQNEILAFDDLQVSRTTSFNLPTTPTNVRLLKHAADINDYGSIARAKVDAVLTFDNTQIQGYIYIGKCTPDSYECIFCFGNMVQLQMLNDAGNIRTNYPIWCNYRFTPVNWVQSGTVHYKDVINNLLYYGDIGEVVQPSVLFQSLVFLTTNSPYGAGLNVDIPNDGRYTRITLTTANGVNASGTIVFNNSKACAVGGEIATLGLIAPTQERVGIWRKKTGGIADYNGISYFETYGIILKEKCSIRFDTVPSGDVVLGDFTSSYAQGAFTEYLNADGDTIKAGDTVEFAANSVICAVNPQTAYKWEYGVTIQTGATSWEGDVQGWFDISGGKWRDGFTFGVNDGVSVRITVDDTTDLPTGHTYSLHTNLPNLTYSEMLRAYGAVVGKMLAYDVSEDKFYYSDLSTYAVKEISPDKVIEYKDIERAYGKFSQNNVVTSADDVVLQNYTIDNAALDALNEFVELPFEVGSVRSDGYQHVNGNDEPSLMAYGGNKMTVASVRPTIPQVSALKQLCTNSTSCTLSVLMSSSEFFELESNEAIGWHGCVWFWTEATWSDGVAELTLSKYK